MNISSAGSVSELQDLLRDNPERFIHMSTTERFSIPSELVRELQLSALRGRFDDLRARIPTLNRFAEGQRLERIESLEDGALLLFPHTLYKSYPLSAVNNARFDVVTRWLGALTAIDLSKIDASRCEDIDGWIDMLDNSSNLRVRHSSGTTGKLSFVPVSQEEARFGALNFKSSYTGFGDEPNSEITDFETTPMLGFSHRKGAQATSRSFDALLEFVYGGNEEMIIALWPTRVSADLMALGGRLAGARAMGDQGRLKLSSSLLAKREQAIREQTEQPRMLHEFFDRLNSRKGQKVYYKGALPPAIDTAIAGLSQGYSGMVAQESVGAYSGGTKGRKLPEDYREILTRFMGATYPPPGYGMSEAVAAFSLMCPAGHYHIQPMSIAYVLHPETGMLHPRTGRQTGRFGLIDLCAISRWGGFLTGDEVTVDWGDDRPCPCGRIGAYMLPDIHRYSVAEGGDDKITCAGAQDVQDKALDFIRSYTDY